MKRLLSRTSTLLVTVTLLAIGGVSEAQVYEPAEGDSVVIYINKFKASEFERAKEIMVDGFSWAMEASGQTRRTFWMANEETGEIVGVSFFQKGHSVDEWHDHEARQTILDQLDPLRSAPLVKQHYRVIGHHRTAH